MSETNETSSRGQSSIQFPYSDLADGMSVVEGFMKGGGVPLSRDQLAAAMNQAPGSGSFNTKLGTARAFGLIKTIGRVYELTDLGFEIHDETRRPAAMVQAFLNVELYKRTYDEFRGKLLPPRPHGLENAFVNFGVVAKQKERARQAFDRSARLAGFFPNGNEDRLVMPLVGAGMQNGKPSENDKGDENKDDTTRRDVSTGSNANKGGATGDQLIDALVAKLPPAGQKWSVDDRVTWLQMISMAFQLGYGQDGAIEIKKMKLEDLLK